MTYAHLGSGEPQSAQNRLSDWVKSSLILLLPVKATMKIHINAKPHHMVKKIILNKGNTWARLSMSGCRIITHCSSKKANNHQTTIMLENIKKFKIIFFYNISSSSALKISRPNMFFGTKATESPRTFRFQYTDRHKGINPKNSKIVDRAPKKSSNLFVDMAQTKSFQWWNTNNKKKKVDLQRTKVPQNRRKNRLKFYERE